MPDSPQIGADVNACLTLTFTRVNNEARARPMDAGSASRTVMQFSNEGLRPCWVGRKSIHRETSRLKIHPCKQSCINLADLQKHHVFWTLRVAPEHESAQMFTTGTFRWESYRTDWQGSERPKFTTENSFEIRIRPPGFWEGLPTWPKKRNFSKSFVAKKC